MSTQHLANYKRLLEEYGLAGRIANVSYQAFVSRLPICHTMPPVRLDGVIKDGFIRTSAELARRGAGYQHTDGVDVLLGNHRYVFFSLFPTVSETMPLHAVLLGVSADMLYKSGTVVTPFDIQELMKNDILSRSSLSRYRKNELTGTQFLEFLALFAESRVIHGYRQLYEATQNTYFDHPEIKIPGRVSLKSIKTAFLLDTDTHMFGDSGHAEHILTSANIQLHRVPNFGSASRKFADIGKLNRSLYLIDEQILKP